MSSSQYAKSVMGPNKKKQEMFLRLYNMGLSQEKAKSIVLASKPSK